MQYLEYTINNNKKVLFVKTENGINLVPINRSKFKSYNKSDSEANKLEIDPRYIYQQAYGKCRFDGNLNRVDISNYFEDFYKGVMSGDIEYPIDDLVKMIVDYNDYLNRVETDKLCPRFVSDVDNAIIKMQLDVYKTSGVIDISTISKFVNVQRNYKPDKKKAYYRYSMVFITDFVYRISASYSDIADNSNDVYDFLLYIARNYNNGERQLIVSQNIKFFEAAIKYTHFTKYNIPCNLWESYHIALYNRIDEVTFENMSREFMLKYMVDKGCTKERLDIFYSKSYRIKPHNGTELDANILLQIVNSGDAHIYRKFIVNNGTMHVNDLIATVDIIRKSKAKDSKKQMLFTAIYKHSHNAILNYADELFYFDMIDRLFGVCNLMMTDPHLTSLCFSMDGLDISLMLIEKSFDHALSLNAFVPMYEMINVIDDEIKRKNFIYSLKLLENIRKYEYSQLYTILRHDSLYKSYIKLTERDEHGRETVIVPGHNATESGLFTDIENTTEPEDSNEGKSIFSRIKSFFKNK